MAVKDFVLVEVHDRYTRLLGEYVDDMHPVLKEHNNILKDRYETILLKVEADHPLNEVEATELYHILNDAHDQHEHYQADCSRAFYDYCYPILQENSIEWELKQNHKRYFRHLKG